MVVVEIVEGYVEGVVDFGFKMFYVVGEIVGW